MYIRFYNKIYLIQIELTIYRSCNFVPYYKPLTSSGDVELQVTKSHGLPKVEYTEKTMMFTTVESNNDEWLQDDEAHQEYYSFVDWTSENIAYTQFYNQLSSCSLCELPNYGSIFNLTNMELQHLQQYMRYWMILRQCCGSTMSKWYQGEILGCPNITNNVLIEGEYDFHMCSTRNLSEVEHRFSQTYLYQHVPHFRHNVGDCAKSHEDVRSGRGFNNKKIGGDFCSELLKRADKKISRTAGYWNR